MQREGFYWINLHGGEFFFQRNILKLSLGLFLKKYKIWIERFFVAGLATLVF